MRRSWHPFCKQEGADFAEEWQFRNMNQMDAVRNIQRIKNHSYVFDVIKDLSELIRVLKQNFSTNYLTSPFHEIGGFYMTSSNK